jgi:hypothetical protein
MRTPAARPPVSGVEGMGKGGRIFSSFSSGASKDGSLGRVSPGGWKGWALAP